MAQFASSYIKTTTAAASRSADDLEHAINFTPADIEARGGLTVLTEWVELGTAFGNSDNRCWQIGGSAAETTPYLQLRRRSAEGDGSVSARVDMGAGAFASVLSAGTVSLFDHVRARTVIYLDGSDWKIQLHVSVNGGAETSASAATIGSSLPAAWSENTLTIGSAPGGSLYGYAGMIALKFAWGNQSLTYMDGAT